MTNESLPPPPLTGTSLSEDNEGKEGAEWVGGWGGVGGGYWQQYEQNRRYHELVQDPWLSSLVFKWIKPTSRQGSDFSRVSVWEFLARLQAYHYHGEV